MRTGSSSRILVVEDDALLAWELQDILSSHGCQVVGPIGRLPILLAHLQRVLPETAGDAAIDAAILDVTIDGGLVFPAADMLARAGVPFAFVSGHAGGMIPPMHRHRPLLNKPFDPAELLDLVAQLIETAERPAPKPARRRKPAGGRARAGFRS